MLHQKRFYRSLPLFLTPIITPYANADFLGESKMNLGLRNIYYNADYRNNSSGSSKLEEWGQGFRLDYQSGFTEGALGVGVDALGLVGVTLDSGRGRHVGSSMIPSSGDAPADEWSRFGLAFKGRISKTELRIGTLMPKLPILMANDGRLLTQTFQGGMITSNELEGFTLVAGKIDQATGRASTDRTGLAVSGGQKESNQFYFTGMDYALSKNLLIQYYRSDLENYYHQQFLGATHTFAIADNRSLKTDLRYFRTRAQGANRSGESGYQVGGYTSDNDGEIDNNTWSATLIYTLGAHRFLGGFQRVSDDSAFVQPNQGSLAGGVDAGGAAQYTYTDRLASTFNRAGQTTRYAQYSYDFAGLGIPGLTASFMYLNSKNIKSFDKRELRESERDFLLGYVIQQGPLKGLGVLWMNGKLWSDVTPEQDQNRLVFNYSIPLL